MLLKLGSPSRGPQEIEIALLFNCKFFHTLLKNRSEFVYSESGSTTRICIADLGSPYDEVGHNYCFFLLDSFFYLVVI
jgi:hypothetical protein